MSSNVSGKSSLRSCVRGGGEKLRWLASEQIYKNKTTWESFLWTLPIASPSFPTMPQTMANNEPETNSKLINWPILHPSNQPTSRPVVYPANRHGSMVSHCNASASISACGTSNTSQPLSSLLVLLVGHWLVLFVVTNNNTNSNTEKKNKFPPHKFRSTLQQPVSQLAIQPTDICQCSVDFFPV